MAEFPALPLWTDAYLGDTTHLNVTEHGAYFLLMVTAWRTATCSLPDDDRLLARYARCELRQWKKLRPIIEPFFVIKDGQWHQGRLTDEREACFERREKAAANGRASALKRKGRHATSKRRSLPETNSKSPKTRARDVETKPLETNDQRATERKQSVNGATTERELSENLTIDTNITPISPLNEKPTKRLLPGDWEPGEFGEGSEAAVIVSRWTEGEHKGQLERFSDYHRAKGSKFVDWQAAWGTWVRNSVNFTSPVSHSTSSSYDLVEEINANPERWRQP